MWQRGGAGLRVAAFLLESLRREVEDGEPGAVHRGRQQQRSSERAAARPPGLQDPTSVGPQARTRVVPKSGRTLPGGSEGALSKRSIFRVCVVKGTASPRDWVYIEYSFLIRLLRAVKIGAGHPLGTGEKPNFCAAPKI